jgi:hypothetical protein
MLKGLKAKDLQIKLEQVYEDGALEIEAATNGDGVSCSIDSTLEMIHGPDDPPEPIFLTQFTRYPKSSHPFLAECHQDTSGSPKIVFSGLPKKVWDSKIQFKIEAVQT